MVLTWIQRFLSTTEDILESVEKWGKNICFPLIGLVLNILLVFCYVAAFTKWWDTDVIIIIIKVIKFGLMLWWRGVNKYQTKELVQDSVDIILSIVKVLLNIADEYDFLIKLSKNLSTQLYEECEKRYVNYRREANEQPLVEIVI